MRTFVFCAISLFSLGLTAEAAPRFGVDQMLALRDISQLSASPGGDFVAYTITSNDLEKDKRHYSVWITPTAGGDAIRMSAVDSNSSSPKWSSDGRYLAILSDRKDETNQVWLLNRRGGDAQQLTHFAQGVDAFEWSPDGKRMLLMAEDPTPADLDEEKRPNLRPWVIDRLQFKEDYVGYLDRYRSHIHLIDIATGKTRQLTSGDFEDDQAAWSPNGKMIVFVSNRTDDPDRNPNTDLWLIDTNIDDAKPERLTDSIAADASPRWSPNGESIVYTSTDPDVIPDYAIPQLTLLNLNDKVPFVVPALLETQVFRPRYSADSRYILTMIEARGERFLGSIEIETGALHRLIDGEDTVHEFAQAYDGHLYALVSRPQFPAEIFLLGDEGIEQLSFANSKMMDGLKTAALEKFAYASSDGASMEAFVMFPPGYREGRMYPGLLNIHGGPQAQYDYGFNAEAQILAAKGYVIIMPNPRGSTGYGQAFATAIYQDWGGIDYEDVVTAMDHAIAQGWVDPEHTGVFGWSYGGMMTNHVITKTDRFKAAITGASATLYAANYGHDQYQRWWEAELGLPWLAENREKWERISPFYRLDQVKTPTLIVGGEKDWNVPIQNSEQLYIALKNQGVPTQLVVYPDQGHHFAYPSYDKDLYERYIKWFDEWVKK